VSEKEKIFEEMLGSFEVPGGKSKAQAWEEVQLKTVDRNPDGKVVGLRNRWKWTAAAAACFALVVWGLAPHGDEIVINQMAYSGNSVQLPDGSEVVLNGTSELKYDADSWEEGRKVELLGEAYFLVAEGSTFDVESDNGSVTVLGTSFNVSSRDSKLEVACFTGKVLVTKGNKEVILTPGSMTHSKSGTLVEPYLFQNEEPDWVAGVYSFENEPVENVFDELEVRFGYQFELDGADGKLFSGEFEATNLKDALEVICLPLGLEYRIGTNQTVEVRELDSQVPVN
jgi:ferric-dicitrate binding protein FerR (iron transport regulator)